MPELPEIATMVRALRPRLLGRTVTHVVLEEGGLVEGKSVAEVRAALLGREIVGVVRRGKYMRLDLAGSVGGEWIDLFEPRRRNGSLKRSQKSRPLPPDGCLVVRRPETLAEALQIGAGDDWIHGPAIDAIRTAEKRGHSSPIAAENKVGMRIDESSRATSQSRHKKTPQGVIPVAFRRKPTRGFEPRTYALRKHCSTAELSRHRQIDVGWDSSDPSRFPQDEASDVFLLHTTPVQSSDYDSNCANLLSVLQ